MSEGGRRFYGKYRGTCADNADPFVKGRIRAKVQAVYGDLMSGWAEPSFPYAAPMKGFFFVPPVDANVWIEFEEGDPDKPIWTGCFWNLPFQSPVVSQSTPQTAHMVKIMKTDTATITLDDTPGRGGITIEVTGGLKITMNAIGIEISNRASSIKLTTASVSVNNGALEVT